MKPNDQELDALVTKLEGNLPMRREGPREVYKLELTLRERNVLAEALRAYPVHSR